MLSATKTTGMTASAYGFLAMFGGTVILLLALSCFADVVTGVESDSDESLRDVVRTLKGQVNALLERRQEDFNVLEESIRRSLDKNSEVASLKAEMEKLRKEVQKLKGGKKPTLNEQKNDHITVQWLLTAISELRAEITELSTNYNSSAEIQQRQELSSGMDLLRGDVASFRRDLEELRAAQQQTVVTLGQLKQDVESSLKSSQKASAATADAISQFNEVKTEMTSLAKSLTKLTRDFKQLKVIVKDLREEEKNEEEDSKTLSNGLHPNGVSAENERRYRHNRIIRRQVYNLEQSERRMQVRQSHIEKTIRRLEKQVKLKEGEEKVRNANPQDNEVADERLVERIGKLEEANRVASKQLFNLSKQVSELGRLHLSMLQLLESVENLEAKVDRNIPELQKEISKMEFNLAQATSSISVVRQDQENERAAHKGFVEDMNRLQEYQENDRGRLTSFEAQIINLTKSSLGSKEMSDQEEFQNSRLSALEEKLEEHLREKPEVGEAEGTGTTTPTTMTPPLAEALKNGHPFNSSSIPELIESLKTVQKEYDNIVHQLPHDCGVIEGGNGIYAISPGEGPPLLVPCDMTSSPGGWTVVQRRIDGTQEFNQNWKEYATGFGTPSGEFWLGNEALHRLTAENCSSLRIDFKDIYGKKWIAEYEGFFISDAEDGYRIHVNGYSGNASDALEYQNKMQFSAVDSDRDISNTHCAQNYEGGWWFSHCQHANLNGRYNLGLTWFDGARNEWIAVAFSEMKVRRKTNCVT